MVREIDARFAGDQSLYDILQVSPKACPEVIQAAYRVLARVYHPDVSMAADADARTRRLNAAYGILSDPGRRAIYDASRAFAARKADTHRRSTTRERATTATRSANVPAHDRPAVATGATVVVWIVTAAVAVTLVVSALLALWSLFDAFDGPARMPIQPRSSVGGPQQPLWGPPANVPTAPHPR